MPRKKGYRHSEETRSKIQADALIKRLSSIAMGEVEATPAQVNAAKSLLNKCLPDLKSVDMQSSDGSMTPQKMTVYKIPDNGRD